MSYNKNNKIQKTKHELIKYGGEVMSIGWGEILVVLFLVLLLFGGKRLPELARSMGQAVNEFKRGLNTNININESKNSELDVNINEKNEDS